MIVRLRRGRLTVPRQLREALGLAKDGFVSLCLVEGRLELKPIEAANPAARGSPWARELYELFSPVRESLEAEGETEINEAIDDALREARTGD